MHWSDAHAPNEVSVIYRKQNKHKHTHIRILKQNL